ncbi:MAG: hypothetical protein DVB23_001222 [Verrucomicrobia bacterium]|nr:MAG: hypothetical protein DVB23_001222 [Verrucomicrobiota bacterium]
MSRTIVTRSDLEVAQRVRKTQRSEPFTPSKLEASAPEAGAVRTETLVEGETAETGEATSPGGVDGYFDRLAKFIPGEAVALYVTLGGIVEGSQFAEDAGLQWGVFGFSLLFTPFYLAKVARVTKLSQVLVSTFAFAVWSLAIGGALQSAVVQALAPTMADKADALVALISSLALVAFTALVPVFAPDARPVRENA